MKKLLFTFITLSSVYIAQSQELGLRFGDITGIGIDGVFNMSEYNRIHGTVSVGNEIIGMDMLLDFIFHNIGNSSIDGYVGLGGSILVDRESSITYGTGQLGLEYIFRNAPVSIGADWRPKVAIVPNTPGDNANLGSYGLNIRYIF